MTKTFRTALLEHLASSGITVAELARQTGVSKDQINKLRQRENAKTNVDDALKIAKYFGVTLEAFLEDPGLEARSEIVALYSQLSEVEQEMLLAAAKGLAARLDRDTPKPDEAS